MKQQQFLLPKCILVVLLALIFLFAADPSYAVPFNTVDRLDLNSADMYDFMELEEVDFLRAWKLEHRRKKQGEYAQLEDTLDVITPDLLNLISDKLEVGSYKSPRDQYLTGNSFTDLRWFFDRDSHYSYRSRYNIFLSNRVYTRIAYNSGVTGEAEFDFDEVFLEYYTWSDGFFPSSMVTVPRPEMEVHKRIEEGTESMEQRVLKDFDARFNHELLIGRSRKKKTMGMFDTDLNSWQKHWVTKVDPKEEKRRLERAANAVKTPIVEETTVDSRRLKSYNMTVPDKREEEVVIDQNPVMTGIWSFGNVMHPRSLKPLINLQRKDFQGIKYERILGDFRASMLYKQNDDKDLEVISGHAYAFLKDEDIVVGARATRLYNPESENDINHFSCYAIGDIPEVNTHLYGEFQTVFNGATSMHGLVTSHFRDLFITTEILSVKEDYQGPNHVYPLSFDGEFTSSMRMTYKFSRISTLAAWTKRSRLQQGDPDVEVGITKENGMKLFLKATEKSLITIAYSQNLEIDNSWSDNYFARIRYRYNKKFHFYATTTFKDQDVASQLGRTAVNSLEFRIRVRPHTKINLEIQDVWDESKTNTDDEHETIGRINWYRNF